jgi:hypothetical protein
MNKEYPQRTGQQNKALHVFCKLLAEALNDAGLDMRKTLKPEIWAEIDIPWDYKLVKEYIWRPVQQAKLNKKSTTEMNTVNPDIIYDIINRHFSEKFGITIEWPSYFNDNMDELK